MTTDWRVLSTGAATFSAGVCWLLVLQRLELGYAYPLMLRIFAFILVLSSLFLGEPLLMGQLLGLGLVLVGLISSLAR